MNMSNQGGCIHGREFCLECNDKKIPRRPESIGQAHRIMCQMRATIEQQQARIKFQDEVIAEREILANKEVESLRAKVAELEAELQSEKIYSINCKLGNVDASDGELSAEIELLRAKVAELEAESRRLGEAPDIVEQSRTLARAFMDGQFPNKKATGILIAQSDLIESLEDGLEQERSERFILQQRIDEPEERTALAWIPASDLPEEKKYTPCLLAVWYRLAVDFSVTLEKGAYDGYSKSFEWKEGQYSNDENYTVLGWVPINCILLPPPPEQSDDR